MFDELLGTLLNGFGGQAAGGGGMMPFGGEGGGNFMGLLSQAMTDPAAREAFLNRAAMGADPSVFMGAMQPAGGNMVPQPPTQATGGMVPPGPTAGIMGQSATQAQVPPPPMVPPGPTAGMWGEPPMVPEEPDPNLGWPSQPQQPQMPLGAMLRGGAGAMPKRDQPQQPRPATVSGAPGHGSVNRTQAPGYLPQNVNDPQAARRRATLAALLGGR